MRDFPVFSTENGVGSLVFKEIPYSGNAYIKILDASEPKAFLDECIEFCRVAGAKHILASGHSVLESYPFHTAIWKMTAQRSSLPETDGALFPVTEKTSGQWMQIYNDKMKNVPNTGYMSLRDMEQMIKTGDGYFVHKDGVILGIGKASGDRIDVVISVVQGAGQTVVAALCHALSDEQVQLEVASVNTKAIALYERLGFIRSCELSRWYQVQ